MDEIKSGDIVDCGAYGSRIYVCWVEGDRFWGTDEREEFNKGNDARGWYFYCSQVQEVIGNVND